MQSEPTHSNQKYFKIERQPSSLVKLFDSGGQISIREIRTHRGRGKVYEFDGFILNLDTRLIYLVWECLAKRILSRSRAVLEKPRYASEGKRASRREEFAFTRFRWKVLKSHEMNGERQLAAAGIL